MKKVILSVVVLVFMNSMVGQNTQVDQVSNSVFQKLRSLPTKSFSLTKKLLDLERAVDYLKGARNCLSGIGCSTRQSYLANYLLGATNGFAQNAAFLAIAKHNPTLWYGNLPEGKPGLIVISFLLQDLVNELGYRYLVKNKVYLFRCLTFRGCTDQTKRYAFYNLGIWSGRIGSTLGMIGLQKVQTEIQKQYIQINDDEVKEALNLNKSKNAFR